MKKNKWNTKSIDSGPKYRKVVTLRHGCRLMNALLKLKYSCRGVTRWHCTAKLVPIAAISQVLVIGGMSISQASNPTGITRALQ